MTSIPIFVSSLQALPESSRDGLPFGVFWFLLCIILLLLFFIFLRDKDLRRRLSAFLSGARRTMLRLRLQAKLKKEREKKSDLRKELGRKAWSKDIQVEGTADLCRRLKVLEDEIGAKQKEGDEINSQIEALGKRYESVRKSQQEIVQAEEALKNPFKDRMAELKGREKEYKKQRTQAEKEIRDAGAAPKAAEPTASGPTVDEIKGRLASIGEEEAKLEKDKAAVQAELDARDRKIRELELKHKEEGRTSEMEIREWEKKKEAVEEQIKELKKTSEPLYESLGKTLDESRIEHGELALCYSQIDGVNKEIQDLQTRIEKLQ